MCCDHKALPIISPTKNITNRQAFQHTSISPTNKHPAMGSWWVRQKAQICGGVAWGVHNCKQQREMWWGTQTISERIYTEGYQQQFLARITAEKYY
jgi:hypothetical protein